MRYCSSLFLLLTFLGCEDSPETVAEAADMVAQQRRLRAEEFCERAEDCETLEILFSTEECTLQAHQRLERLFVKPFEEKATQETSLSLFDAPRCQHCITALTCSGMTEVANGRTSLEALCPNCADRIKTATQPGSCLLSGITKKRLEISADQNKNVEEKEAPVTPKATAQ